MPNIVPPGSIAAGTEIKSPQNTFLGSDTANLGASRGFEGMAINPKGDTLYTLLEGTVTGNNDVNDTDKKICALTSSISRPNTIQGTTGSICWMPTVPTSAT